MKNVRIAAFTLIIVGAAIGWFVYSSERNAEEGAMKFRLGLDLNGGTHLVYKADVSKVASGEVGAAMQTLRDVIERRVNSLKVSEPIVQIEQGSSFSDKGSENKLIVELPGVSDVEEAKKIIGETPVLEFKLLDKEVQKEIEAQQKKEQDSAASSTFVGDTASVKISSTTLELYKKLYISTGITGALLQKATVQFSSAINTPNVGLVFNDAGKSLFAKVTKEHKGDVLAIFLDGEVISSPVIQSEISDGKAEITGKFSIEEAKTLVRNLNYGALPVPVELISTQTIGASLGGEATKAGVHAGIFAFIIIALFLILWYRLPGFLAVIALMMYVILNLTIFKLFSVTLTAAGMAAFILSIGMAVDANILIFERVKEELKRGKDTQDAIHEGFSRAWPSIRDSNLSSIITAIILYFFPSTSIIQGFAFVFFIGVAVSMFSAISFSRTLLLSIGLTRNTKFTHFLLSSGFTK